MTPEPSSSAGRRRRDPAAAREVSSLSRRLRLIELSRLTLCLAVSVLLCLPLLSAQGRPPAYEAVPGSVVPTVVDEGENAATTRALGQVLALLVATVLWFSWSVLARVRRTRRLTRRGGSRYQREQTWSRLQAAHHDVVLAAEGVQEHVELALLGTAPQAQAYRDVALARVQRFRSRVASLSRSVFELGEVSDDSGGRENALDSRWADRLADAGLQADCLVAAALSLRELDVLLQAEPTPPDPPGAEAGLEPVDPAELRRAVEVDLEPLRRAVLASLKQARALVARTTTPDLEAWVDGLKELDAEIDHLLAQASAQDAQPDAAPRAQAASPSLPARADALAERYLRLVQTGLAAAGTRVATYDAARLRVLGTYRCLGSAVSAGASDPDGAQAGEQGAQASAPARAGGAQAGSTTTPTSAPARVEGSAGEEG